MEFIDVSAKTIEDAIAKGVAQLAAEGQELVETKVLEQPSNGFLGIGRKPAVVRLFFTSVAKTATQRRSNSCERTICSYCFRSQWQQVKQKYKIQQLKLLKVML